ncbi:hypothetical protein Mboo_0511 [Methanoregula boonei 6A8]|jgi:uncharacterized membrane protein YvbJ|uniref:Zinc-ribbon domain-containing protein n=1 Tax=Methanoregula boonei (strain DSM 21154 / JCM 14090 / 6A8) TaxID=456442 RepID=A7I5L8_METB6|nr:hypothetical protein Mboo_0511 [Methanoregula boonei 6A8]
MFCQKCGAQNADDAAFCNSCGTQIVRLGESPKDKVIQAKIQTKRDQIAGISQTGPILLCLLGLPCLLLYIIPGAIMIGVAIWWSSSRENEKKKLENEIKELQAEIAAIGGK